MNDKFNNCKHKRQYWVTTTAEMKEIWPELPHTYAHVQKRYDNSFTTYKREKQEHSGTGTEPSEWPFFELFDSVLHYRKDVSLENTHGRKRSFKESIRDIIPANRGASGLPETDDISAMCGYDPVIEQEEREAATAPWRIKSTPPEKKRRPDVRAQLMGKLEAQSEKSDERIASLRLLRAEDREERAQANAVVIEKCKENRETSENLMNKIDQWLKIGGFSIDSE
ncbi:uncharacterized protein LOC129601489 [Paramacrobiotus metropolitanus]|uniref:uncharacterized protein LOC129601489 n=1 Tax=Paramacrobiotus metropolitanus TaxID=2943436 RepID=UPI002445FB41|nr:uncharacterized protein LOC129601489 [Paramacrobiotus metropolitanus]